MKNENDLPSLDILRYPSNIEFTSRKTGFVWVLGVSFGWVLGVGTFFADRIGDIFDVLLNFDACVKTLQSLVEA